MALPQCGTNDEVLATTSSMCEPRDELQAGGPQIA
jgi:hypothetical protein